MTTTDAIATEVIECLNDLTQLDMDAIEAYDQALKNIETSNIHEKLESFKNDHKQHIIDLARVVKNLHGEPIGPGKDFKGFIIKGMTAIQSAMGEKSALKAMQSNEELTNKTYAKALEKDLPPEAKLIVEKNYRDEQEHLKYIRAILA